MRDVAQSVGDREGEVKGKVLERGVVRDVGTGAGGTRSLCLSGTSDSEKPILSVPLRP